MHIHADKPRQSISNTAQAVGKDTIGLQVGLENSNTHTEKLDSYQFMADASPQVKKMAGYQQMADNNTIQKKLARVKPTLQMKKNKVDAAEHLESEAADTIGDRTLYSPAPAVKPIPKGQSASSAKAPVQRVIIRMDEVDPVTTHHVEGLQGNAPSAVSNIEPGHKQAEAGREGILTNIGNDTIYIVGHGSPASIGEFSYSPAELAGFLIGSGLPLKYTGKIVLVACNTGQKIAGSDPRSYAQRLQDYLNKHHGIKVAVDAPPGALKVTKAGKKDAPFNIRSLAPEKEDEYQARLNPMLEALRKLGTHMDALNAKVAASRVHIEEEIKRLGVLDKHFLAEAGPAMRQINNLEEQLEEIQEKATAASEEEGQKKAKAIAELKIQIEPLEKTVQAIREKHNIREVLERQAALKAELKAPLNPAFEEIKTRLLAQEKEIDDTMENLMITYLLPIDKSLIHLPAPK